MGQKHCTKNAFYGGIGMNFKKQLILTAFYDRMYIINLKGNKKDEYI